MFGCLLRLSVVLWLIGKVFWMSIKRYETKLETKTERYLRLIFKRWECNVIPYTARLYRFRIAADLVRELTSIGYDIPCNHDNMKYESALIISDLFRDCLKQLPDIPENQAFKAKMLELLVPIVDPELEVSVLNTLKFRFPVVKGGGVSSKLPNFPSQLRRNLR